MASPKCLFIHVGVRVRFRPLDLARLIVPLLLGVALLWPGQAEAAVGDYVWRMETLYNTWSPASWFNSNTSSYVTVPDVDEIAVLSTNTPLRDLTLGFTNTPIGGLIVQSADNWQISNGTLDIYGNLIVRTSPATPDGTFTIGNGTDTTTVSADDTYLNGTLKLDAATLTTNNVTVAETLTTWKPGKLVVANGSTLNAIGDITVNTDATLDVSGSEGADSTVYGNSLTVHAGGTYKDDAHSVIYIAEDAYFEDPGLINIQGFFTSKNLETEGDLTIGGDPRRPNAVTTADGGERKIGGALTLEDDVYLQGFADTTATDVYLGERTWFEANDLTVTGSYQDTESSAVDIRGKAIFNGPDITINAAGEGTDFYGFRASGIDAAGKLTFDEGAIATLGSDGLTTGGNLDLGVGATVNTNEGARNIGGDLKLEENAQLLGEGDNANTTANNVTLGAGSKLTGNDLTATGNFHGGSGSNAELTGDADITGYLILEDDAKLLGKGDVKADDVTLGNGSELAAGKDLTVSGAYQDEFLSKVQVGGEAQFTGGPTTIKSGEFDSQGITTAGALTLDNTWDGTEWRGAVVDTHNGARNIGGDLKLEENAQLLGEGDNANTTANNVTLGAGSKLTG
ncbi:MAG: hypothetical protein FWG03_11190, partial [Clostridiales bacterium]|nr:hypothetical protein [Clostridiales bacterium]